MTAKPKNYIACFGFSVKMAEAIEGKNEEGFQFLPFSSFADFLLVAQYNKLLFRAVVVDSDGLENCIDLKKQVGQAGYGHLPFCLLTEAIKPQKARELQTVGVMEIFLKPISPASIVRKLQLIQGASHGDTKPSQSKAYKMPWNKRLFDIICASLILLFLSPLFALIALLIRLESKGPVFYYSLRVGTGYKIFKFYKFRSMSVDADKKLSQLKHLNQYSEGKTVATTKVKQLCEACAASKTECNASLYADNEMWCEKLYKEHLQSNSGQAFLKIKDDPRITKVGKFIRNTSIDELPQLWNVIKGDMSLVGNRPLPLYEAEKLTTDKYALRFMAPAGITGLWQVSKRGSGKMSEEERISLDNDYAKSYGLLFDIKLLLRTIPALLQKENV